MGLAPIDTAIILLYMAGILFLGMYLSRYVRGGMDYFLGGKRLPWWAIGMSLVVSDIGAMDMVGLAGSAYIYGIVLANFDWIGCIPAMLVSAFVFVPYFWISGVYTVPEYLGRRFHPAVRAISAAVWVLFMTLNLGLLLYTSGNMFQTVVGSPEGAGRLFSLFAPSYADAPFAPRMFLGGGIADGGGVVFWILVTAAIVGIYTFSGGLAAVVITDAAQFVIMMIGAAAILIFGLAETGGVSGVVERIEALGKADHFRLVLGTDTTSPYAWPAIILGLGLVLSPAYWIGNQAIMQRVLGARSAYDAKAGVIWGSALKVFIPFVMVVPGLVALSIRADIADADDVMPALLKMLLPPGLMGLVFAAFLAALMSSVDSYLNSAATLWTKEIYRRFFVREADDRGDLVVGRIMTVMLIVLAIVTTPLAARFESIYSYFQTLLSTFQGPTFALLLLGMIWKRATGAGALAGLLAGLAVSVPLNYVEEAKSFVFRTKEPFLYVAWWSFFAALLVTILVSLFTRPKSAEELEGLVYRRKGASR